MFLPQFPTALLVVCVWGGGVVGVVACIVNLLPLCKYEKIRTIEKTGYSHDPDTSASYCPFFFLKLGRRGVNFLDANLIRVAPECRNPGGACLSVS
jgi:hypothetical protein